MLAQHDSRHFIACTSDGGQVCLSWRHARLEFAPSELLAMADFLNETVPTLKTNTLLGNSLYCVLQDEDDNIEIWLLGVGFYMAPSEFRRFMTLIVDGAEAVRTIAQSVSENPSKKEILH
ncbi:MAG: hypothetical protein AAF702_06465 [Chloroflexota bacterium]